MNGSRGTLPDRPNPPAAWSASEGRFWGCPQIAVIPASYPRPFTTQPFGAISTIHHTKVKNPSTIHHTTQVVKDQVVEEQVVGATSLWITR